VTPEEWRQVARNLLAFGRDLLLVLMALTGAFVLVWAFFALT
jgi:hypothetical protein